MDFYKLIDSFRPELAHFTAHDYPPSFQRFEVAAAPLFDVLADPEAEAGALMAALEATLSSLSRREQKQLLTQIKMVLVLYLCPAADRRGGSAMDYIRAVHALWSAQYPRYPFTPGSFDDIMQGFEATFLGIPLKNFTRR